jgi:hypothetical protein
LQANIIIGASLRVDTMNVKPSKHIHICPVRLYSEIAEIALAKQELMPILKSEENWNRYWDDLCHMEISHFVSNASDAISLISQ